MKLQEFLGLFNGPVEISNGKMVFNQDTETIVTGQYKDNPFGLYFCAGGKNSNRRIGDNDVKLKNYFVIDLDIYEVAGIEESTTENLRLLTEVLKGMLDEHEYFKEYSAIVLSGYGIHIYYRHDKSFNVGQNITIKEYKFGVQAIYKKFEEYIYKASGGAPEIVNLFKPDVKCCNLARIMRLPYSYNTKNKDGEGNRLVEILYLNKVNSKIIPYIPTLGKQLEKEERERQEQAAHEAMQKNIQVKQLKGEDNLAKINSFPIQDLVMQRFPRTKESPGKVQFLKQNGEFYGFFVNTNKNILINGGSGHFCQKEAYTTYNFIKCEHFGEELTNAETFKAAKLLLKF